MRLLARPAFALAFAGCAHGSSSLPSSAASPAPAPSTHAAAPSSAPRSPSARSGGTASSDGTPVLSPDSHEPAVGAPDVFRPKSAYRWICDVGHSGGQEIYLAVADDGRTFELAGGGDANGPFGVMRKDGGTSIFRQAIEGQTLDDPDFADVFATLGTRREAVRRAIIYGVAMRGPWSMGLIVLEGPSGAEVAHGGWSMRAANARPCDGP